MASLVGDLLIRIAGDNKQFDKAVQDSGKKAETLQKKFKKIGDGMAKAGRAMTKFVTLPILGIGAAMVKVASDAEETESKFNTVFSDIGDRATKTSEELQDAFDLSSVKAQQLLGDTGDLLTGFGFTQDAALDLSSQVQDLALDLASFTNFSGGAEGASKALTKALLGERESIKSLGIAILEEDVQLKILENRQAGITFETERQEKAFATLLIAQDQSKNAIGDYARTQDSLANQMRALKEDVISLSAEFGKALIPMVKDIVEKVRDAVKWFTDLDDGTKKIIITIAGVTAIIGPLLIILPKLITGIIAVKAAITAMTGPIGLVITAVGLLTIGFIALAGATKGAREESERYVTDGMKALETLEDFEEALIRNETLLENILSGKTKGFGETAIAGLKTQIAELKTQISELKGETIELGEATEELTEDQLEVQASHLKVAVALKDINERYKIFGDEVDAAAEGKNALVKAIEDLVEKGFTAEGAGIQSLIEAYGDLLIQAEDTTEKRFEIESNYYSWSWDQIDAWTQKQIDANRKVKEDTRETFDFMTQFAKDNFDVLKERSNTTLGVISGFVSDIGSNLNELVEGQIDGWTVVKRAALNAIASVLRGLAVQATAEAAITWAKIIMHPIINSHLIPGAVKMSAAAVGAAFGAAAVGSLANRRAAKGGLFNSPYIGGEAGPEYAIPDQAPYLNSLASKIESAMGNASINNENMVHVTVNLGSEVLYDDIRKATNDGRLLINTRALV